MSRRSAASLLALGLLLALLVQFGRTPVPYVAVSPGPTIDVLGKNGDAPIVQVEGRRTYPTDGQMRLTTVSITNREAEVSLADALGDWIRDDVSVYPHEVMYPEPGTAEQERTESAALMLHSQDTAIAAALTELGHELTTFPEVIGVNPGGPSDGKLEPRDRIVAIDGVAMTAVEDLFDVLAEVEPGDAVTVEVRRDGRVRPLEITTVASDDDPKRALLGILVGVGYDFPFEISIGIDETIGGSSAGLMFALSVYDTLTPGALTGGHVVAGTGTITPEGVVGPIGGIQQKIIGAEESGAELFLVPPANCAAATQAPVDGIRLVRADTLRSAVESLQKYTEDQTADLPRCPT